MIHLSKRHRTVPVRVGPITVGGDAPVVVQSMTMTDTTDAASTAAQCIELWEAGSEMVRVTVNIPEAAAAVPEIKQRMLDAGCHAPLIGDFHYNGHLLLTRYPECNSPPSAKWRSITTVPFASASTAARSIRNW
jgi:(E)-4-hydroxy-3-methylbut-2-enyl-diphosphate synthase